MKSLIVSIDIDGTLLDRTDKDGRKPNLPMLTLIDFFRRYARNVSLHFLSSRTIEQQQEIANRLGLASIIDGYHFKDHKSQQWKPDIHIDDAQWCELGDKTLIVNFDV